jgi:hypothetical protein
MEKETLQEAAERIFNIPDDKKGDVYFGSNIAHLRKGFNFGAKWQAERMYSEAIEFAEWIRIKDFQTASKNNWIGLDMKYYTTQELFEQYKKK